MYYLVEEEEGAAAGAAAAAAAGGGRVAADATDTRPAVPSFEKRALSPKAGNHQAAAASAAAEIRGPAAEADTLMPTPADPQGLTQVFYIDPEDEVEAAAALPLVPGRSFLRERLGVSGEVVQDLRQVGRSFVGGFKDEVTFW